MWPPSRCCPRCCRYLSREQTNTRNHKHGHAACLRRCTRGHMNLSEEQTNTGDKTTHSTTKPHAAHACERPVAVVPGSLLPGPRNVKRPPKHDSSSATKLQHVLSRFAVCFATFSLPSATAMHIFLFPLHPLSFALSRLSCAFLSNKVFTATVAFCVGRAALCFYPPRQM